MSMTLRLSYQIVHFQNIFTDCLGKIKLRYNRLDITQASVHVVVAMSVIMIMIVMVIMMVVIVMVVVAVLIIVVMMVAVSVVMTLIVVMMVAVLVVMTLIVLMMVMVSVDVETLFLLAVYGHPQMGTPNAAFIHGLRSICDSRNSKHIQFLQHMFRIRVKFQKGSRKHIARRTHIAFEV